MSHFFFFNFDSSLISRERSSGQKTRKLICKYLKIDQDWYIILDVIDCKIQSMFWWINNTPIHIILDLLKWSKPSNFNKLYRESETYFVFLMNSQGWRIWIINRSFALYQVKRFWDLYKRRVKFGFFFYKIHIILHI